MMKQNKPLISVIMPVHNGERFLKESIESILKQSFKDFEFLIIDDGSSDKSREILESYRKKDGRVKIIEFPAVTGSMAWQSKGKSQGISKSLNQLLKHTRGEYIARMDADDIADPQRLEKQLRFLEKNPKIDICGSDAILINEYGKRVGIKKYPGTHEEILSSFFYFTPILHPTLMARKKCFERCTYDEKFGPAEDLKLFVDRGKMEHFANVAEPLLCYRIHNNNSVLGKYKLTIQKTLEARKYAISIGYHFGWKARLAFGATWLAQWLPAKVGFWLFTLLRKIS